MAMELSLCLIKRQGKRFKPLAYLLDYLRQKILGSQASNCTQVHLTITNIKQKGVTMPSIKEAENMFTCQELIEILQSMGYTQKDIADKIGVTTMSIHRYTKTDKIKKSVFVKLKRLYLQAKNPKYKQLENFDTAELVRALKSRGWEVTITSK
jgi:DNA-binding XRE family transcriptional regulator